MIKSDQGVCNFYQKITSITLIPDEFIIFLKVYANKLKKKPAFQDYYIKIIMTIRHILYATIKSVFWSYYRYTQNP